MSYVLRYTTDGGVKERFFQFGDVSGDKHAEAIAHQVLAFLEDCACTNKVPVLRWSCSHGLWTEWGPS